MKQSNLKKDEIIFDASRHRKTKLVDNLEMFSNMPLPSSLLSKEETKKAKSKKNHNGNTTDEEEDEWLLAFAANASKSKQKRRPVDIFKQDKKKEKQSKKKKKNGLTDYRQEFEPELALFKNLLVDQNKLVDSMQKKYDVMESQKGTSKGIGKFENDLMANISTARSMSKDLVKEIVNLKKTIADLSMKEQKEFLSKQNDEQNDISNYAATYLRKMLDVNRGTMLGDGDTDITDSNEDDLFDGISESLGESDRSDDIDTYLRYEKDNVEIFVELYPDGDYEFVAKTEKGKVLDDYPLPEKTKLDINLSMGIATDRYGQKFSIIEVGNE